MVRDAMRTLVTGGGGFIGSHVVDRLKVFTFLTRAEIEQGINETGVDGVDAKELDAMMKHYDVNKDGSISRWESEHVLDKPVPDMH